MMQNIDKELTTISKIKLIVYPFSNFLILVQSITIFKQNRNEIVFIIKIIKIVSSQNTFSYHVVTQFLNC